LFTSPPRNLNDGVLTAYSVDDLVHRVRTGRPLELSQDLSALRARAGETEAIVAHLQRLPSIDWKTVNAGWEIYGTRCVTCHGEYGKPVGQPPPGVRAPRDLSSAAFQKSMTTDQLVVAVRHGRRHMPALVPRIPSTDGTALAAFVRLLSPGFESYSRYCSNCHGDDGRGVGGTGEPDQEPTVRFDRSYFSRRDPEQIRERVWHMIGEHKPAMPHLRWTLTEAEVRAIIESLKGRQ
jgi:mono/diheme cytochrome c family protein